MNVFDKALERLRTTGWQKGEYGEECGPNCIAGALIFAKAELEETDSDLARLGWMVSPTTKLVESVIAEQYPDRETYVADFNDNPNTTFEDVEKVLEKASVRLNEQV